MTTLIPSWKSAGQHECWEQKWLSYSLTLCVNPIKTGERGTNPSEITLVGLIRTASFWHFLIWNVVLYTNLQHRILVMRGNIIVWNPFESSHLEDQEGDGILKWILLLSQYHIKWWALVLLVYLSLSRTC